MRRQNRSLSLAAAIGTLILASLVACSQGDTAQSKTTPQSRSLPANQPPDNLKPLVQRVDTDRIMRDVTTLAATPRHPKENLPESKAAASYIEQQYERAGLQAHRIDVTVDGITLPVVYAEITGATCPDEVFVMTGHYDTVAGSPGADDDASGVAATLETARILANAKLPGSVVVAGLPFEEYGPPYPASSALGSTLLDDDRTVTGMISAEMLGYALPEPDDSGDKGDYLNLLGYQGAEDAVATFTGAAETYVPELPVHSGTYPEDTSFISRSDHMAFHELGVPALFATDGANFRTPHYHQPSDTPENITVDFFANSVRTLVAGTAAMASGAC